MALSATHRKRSIAQVSAFIEFADNANRPLSQFLPRDIHAFADAMLRRVVLRRYSQPLSSQHQVRCSAMLLMSVKSHGVAKIKFQPTPKGAQRFKVYSKDEQAMIVDFFRQRGDDWMVTCLS